MAKQPTNDVVEELPAEAKPAAAPKGGSPWLPVVLVVILLPILSFAMTEFVLIPRIKKAIDTSGGASADAHAASAASGHAAPAKASGSHGGGGGGHGKKGDAGATGNVYEFGTLKTNLARPSSTLIIVKFTVRGSAPEFAAHIEAEKDALIDSALKVLSLLTLVDTQTPGIQNIVKSDLIASFNEVLGQPLVENLYFTDFVTQ